jgi:putative ABC transport system substrate-binding protein
MGLPRELLAPRAHQSGQCWASRDHVERCAICCSHQRLQIRVFNASTSRENNPAFAILVRERADALFVAPDELLISRRVQLATLTARHAMPATYASREVVEVGGLMSYGTDIVDMYCLPSVLSSRA